MIRYAPAVVALLLLTACEGFPQDAARSLERAHGSALQAGASHDPPWVIVAKDGTPSGPEIELVEALAASEGLRVEWTAGAHDQLMARLADFDLQVVAGGHRDGSPWEPDLGWSRAYALPVTGTPRIDRRLALPPGENALQMTVDRWLAARQADDARAVQP